MNLGILLTATVKPNVKGGNFTVDERMEMYASTLRYYSRKIGKDYPIILVENSDVDLDTLKSEFTDTLNLTIFQFHPDNPLSYAGFDTSKGKGYNEYLMVKKGLDEITDIPALNELTHFLKITGRYPMLNIRSIIREIERRAEKKGIVYMGDIKDTCVYKLIGRDTLSSHWGDSRFFMADINFYRDNLADCYLEMNDYEEGKWAEHYFLNLSRKHRKDSRYIFRFRTQVRFGGISGTLSSSQYRSGTRGYDSLPNRIKANIRQVLRILFPNIWF